MLSIIVMNMLRGMIGNIPDYKVRHYALTYYEKEFISLEDITEIEARISEVGENGES